MSRQRAGAVVVGSVVSLATFLVVGGSVDAEVSACAPTITTTSGRTTAVFTTVGTCSFTLPTEATNISVLVVGGGGAGGWSSEDSTSGGGGGGVVTGSGLTISGVVEITVGAGGVDTDSFMPDAGAMGGDSSIVGTGFSIVADGGARGAGYGDGGEGVAGGSSAGEHSFWTSLGAATKGEVTGLSGLSLHGNQGGVADNSTGGGGGGASAPGGTGALNVGGQGGQGLSWEVNGSTIVVGSGGGGCGSVSDGSGGTNAGSGATNLSGGAGAANRGGGGGCSSSPEASVTTGGAGGSGLVVISYTANSFCRSFRSLGRDPLDVRRQPMDPVELGPGRLACRAGLAG
ncbi:MAG: glycine-rich domain-containing protein [Actinomycetota bacterium]